MEEQINYKGKNYQLDVAKYYDGKTALVLRNSPDDYIKCTVNMEDSKLLKNEVLIKDYSENEGIFETLIKHNIIEDTGKIFKMDYGTHIIEFPIGKLINNK